MPRVEFPAEYLGHRGDGTHYFVEAIGETNWKTSREDIKKHLMIEKPASKYLFEVKPIEKKPTTR